MNINTSAHNSEQPESAEPTPTSIIFAHRETRSNESLYETVDSMIIRAQSVLSLIADLHIESHIMQINPDQICFSIDMVKRELDDIRVVVDAYT